jgi:predicted dehydrogenase
MLVGAGRRGLGAHVPALAASASLRLTAIVETPARLDSLRADSGLTVPVYGNLDDGADAARPDLAIVATPHDSHVMLSKSLVEKGIPTLVEKPPARNAAELDELVRASRACLTPLATMLPFHYKRTYQHFAQLLRSPDLTDATIRINADVPSWPGIDNWRLSREHAGGGVLIDLGYHYLDLLLGSLGRPDSSLARLRATAPMGDAVEDEATVSLRYRKRKLEVAITVRSGATLARRSELLVTKNEKIIYSSCDPAHSDGRETLGTSAPQRGLATLAQLDFLISSGFLTGRWDWREGLITQLEVLTLVDKLYATADLVTNFAGKDTRYEHSWP